MVHYGPHHWQAVSDATVTPIASGNTPLTIPILIISGWAPSLSRLGCQCRVCVPPSNLKMGTSPAARATRGYYCSNGGPRPVSSCAFDSGLSARFARQVRRVRLGARLVGPQSRSRCALCQARAARPAGPSTTTNLKATKPLARARAVSPRVWNRADSQEPAEIPRVTGERGPLARPGGTRSLRLPL